MTSTIHQQVEQALGSRVIGSQALSGGCVGTVTLLTLNDGLRVVAKQGQGLAVEAQMLRYLARESDLPVPGVLLSTEDLLVMDYMDSGDALSPASQRHAAELIAQLHSLTAPQFGLSFDTVIGGLPQDNQESDSWLDFLAEQRLLAMAQQALEVGKLPADFMARLERLCGRLDRWLPTAVQPSLLHGDLWTGNILVKGQRIAGFIDPAIYYGDPEIELAFTTLFGTFDQAFFERYQSIRPLEPGFFEERRDLYLLYPLLVHVRLFGDSYLGSVDRILRQFLE